MGFSTSVAYFYVRVVGISSASKCILYLLSFICLFTLSLPSVFMVVVLGVSPLCLGVLIGHLTPYTLSPKSYRRTLYLGRGGPQDQGARVRHARCVCRSRLQKTRYTKNHIAAHGAGRRSNKRTRYKTPIYEPQYKTATRNIRR